MKPKLSKLTIPERFPKPVESPITYSCYPQATSERSSKGKILQRVYSQSRDVLPQNDICTVFPLQFCRLISDAFARGTNKRPRLPEELVQKIILLSELAFAGPKFTMERTDVDPIRPDGYFDLYLETSPLSHSMIISTASLTLRTAHIQGGPGVAQDSFLVALLKPQRKDIKLSESSPNDILNRVAKCKDGALMFSAAHDDAGELGWTSTTMVCDQEFRSLVHEGDSLGVVRFSGRQAGEVVELQLNTYFDPLAM